MRRGLAVAGAVALAAAVALVHYYRWQVLGAALAALAAAIWAPYWLSPDRRYRRAAATQDAMAARAQAEDEAVGDAQTRMPPEFEEAFEAELHRRGVRGTTPEALRVASQATRAAFVGMHSEADTRGGGL